MNYSSASATKISNRAIFRSVQNTVNKLPLIRTRQFSTPPYHIGGVTENRLGLQVYRTIGKWIARTFRKRLITEEIKHYVSVIDRDGVLVIEDFLEPEQFEMVVSEYERVSARVALSPYRGVKDAKLYRSQVSVDDLEERLPAIRKNFQKNPLLNQLASAVVRRKITKDPGVYLDKYENIYEDGVDNDIENILHADLHTTTVKMFFYLNDVDENNGAFVYAKGSHRLSMARLLHEYDLSIRQARLKKNLSIPDSLLVRRAGEARNIISSATLKRMNVVETPICGKSNTLIITNNIGFHRRGEFRIGRPRKNLLVNYRHLEKPLR